MRFRKLPLEIDAERVGAMAALLFDGGTSEWPEWIRQAVADTHLCFCRDLDGTYSASITTPEGEMAAAAEDWIVRGACGELYAIKDHILAATYEYAGDDDGR